MNKNYTFFGISILLLTISLIFLGGEIYKKYTFTQKYNSGKYKEILSQEYTGTDPEMLHNYGNAAFGAFSGSNFENLEFLQQSISYYSGSLQYWDDNVSQSNYDTLSRLLELLKQQQSQNEQEDKGEDQNGKGGNNSQEQTGDQGEELEKKDDETTTGINGRGSEYLLDEDQEIGSLSESEKKDLERAIDNLKREQISNQRYFGKKPQEGTFDSVFDSFFGNIERGGEKDW